MNDPIVRWYEKKSDASIKLYGDTANGGSDKFYFTGDATGATVKNVQADTDSYAQTVYITNNFVNGSAAVSDSYDMKNCTLSVKDADGGMTTPIIQEKWIKVKCVSNGDSAYTQIGAHFVDTAWAEDSIPVKGTNVTDAGVIKGTANDGNLAGTAISNASECSIIAHPSAAAAPVKTQFKFRVLYTYGETA